MDLNTLHTPLPISPEPVLQMAENDQLYHVVSVACKFALFEALTHKQSAHDLARKKSWDEVTTTRLLDVLAHLGYLELDQETGLYQASCLAEQYLTSQNLLYLGHHFATDLPPGSFGHLLTKCLAGYPSCMESPEPGWNPERLRQIGVSSLNGSLQATVGAVDLGAAKRLLDLGGGHGFYSIALAQKYPLLSATLFDLPQVVDLAREYVRKFQMCARIDLVAGDFLKEEIGTGYDAVLCANILHSTKRETVLEKVWRALNPGGQIIVKCRIADCPSTLATALGKLIWQVRGGKELHSQATWHKYLEQQGFTDIKTLNVHSLFATITGVKK